MGKQGWLGIIRTVLPPAVVVLAGCSLTPAGLTVFPERHPLLDSAKAVLQISREPLPLPRELSKRPLPSYTVEPGDVLLVQPADFDSPVRLPADQPVLTDGTINLGRYGQVIVAGMTVPEIERLVRRTLQTKVKNIGPIVVRIVTRVSKVYYVIGEVNAPGAYPLNGRETVLDGVLAAGGLTDRASPEHVLLSRPTPPGSCRLVLPVCLREIVQLGDTTTNYQLAPGDRIFVPTRTPHRGLLSCFHKGEDCPPCGGPQRACPLGAAASAHNPMGPLPEVVPGPQVTQEADVVSEQPTVPDSGSTPNRTIVREPMPLWRTAGSHPPTSDPPLP